MINLELKIVSAWACLCQQWSRSNEYETRLPFLPCINFHGALTTFVPWVYLLFGRLIALRIHLRTSIIATVRLGTF